MPGGNQHLTFWGHGQGGGITLGLPLHCRSTMSSLASSYRLLPSNKLSQNQINRQLSGNHNGPLAKPLLRGATVSPYRKCTVPDPNYTGRKIKKDLQNTQFFDRKAEKKTLRPTSCIRLQSWTLFADPAVSPVLDQQQTHPPILSAMKGTLFSLIWHTCV